MLAPSPSPARATGCGTRRPKNLPGRPRRRPPNLAPIRRHEAKASGIETPTREDLTRLDKNRKNKGSNEEWEHPHDPDAKITKMKDGRTRLAHKPEHAVDLETGAVVAVTLQPADRGDTTSIEQTLPQVDQNLVAVMKDEKACAELSEQVLGEAVADKGYHSNAVLKDQREREIRTYISEPNRGRRHWEGKLEEREAVYGNRCRIRGERGQRLMRRRGELVERSFAHGYDTGGMRRTHWREHPNILKRLLIHVAGFNLSLVLRKMLGLGTARGLQGLTAAALRRLAACCADLWAALRALWVDVCRFLAPTHALRRRSGPLVRLAA